LRGTLVVIQADRLGAELGLRKLYLKDDSTQRRRVFWRDGMGGKAGGSGVGF
jgi:hypothetical protein